jgi:4-hydroxy 2-oxovalerate aldolase
MYPEDVHRIYSIINHNLDSNIKIGFHSHNNLQLSFANAQLFISEGLKREGGVIIDSSIYGMGRGAGNLSTELITQYINQTYGHKYDPLPLLNVADVYLSQIYMKTPWGYSIPYYLSAVNNCHPNYSNYLMTKKIIKRK